MDIAGEEIKIDLESWSRNDRAVGYGKSGSLTNKTFVILGAGAAGAAAVRHLRALGFEGKFFMVSLEPRRPYDRTLLSKMYLSGHAGSKQLPLQPESLFDDCEFLVAEVQRVDPERCAISFKANRPTLRYDKLLIATGGKPKQLDLSQSAIQPLVLRNVEDADRLLAAAAQTTNAILIGASFISMEVASSLQERGLQVTAVSREKIPLLKQLGQQMGQLLLEKHLQKGIRFLPETEVEAINQNHRDSFVKLTTGEEVLADLVVSGLGVELATDFLGDIPRHEDKSISVDYFMKVSENIYAVGDIANFPLPDGRRTRIEHWRVAQEQAIITASNMMGLKQVYLGVPHFWTYHYGTRFEFFGQRARTGDLLVYGDLNQPKFIAGYIYKEQCEAVFAANRESATARIFEYMERQGPPSLTTFDSLRALIKLTSCSGEHSPGISTRGRRIQSSSV